MYLIKSQDPFFKEIILNLLLQKNFPINADNKYKIYGTINFKFSQDTLSIKYENEVFGFKAEGSTQNQNRHCCYKENERYALQNLEWIL